MARTTGAVEEVSEALAATEDPKRSAGLGRNELQRARRVEAMSLRLAGFSYDQIAERMEVTSSTAHRWVHDALRRAENRNARELRTIENARLDRAQAAIWSKVISGDLQAINTFLRISERRSKMNGIDAPTQLEMSVTIRQEMEEALQELEAVILEAEVVEEGGDDGRGQIEGS